MGGNKTLAGATAPNTNATFYAVPYALAACNSKTHATTSAALFLTTHIVELITWRTDSQQLNGKATYCLPALKA